MEWGPHLKSLVHVAKTTGRPPKALLSRPEIYPDLALFYEAFWELSRKRSSGGFGPNPITYTEMIAYCELHYIEETATFARYISACDEILLDHVERKNAQKVKK